MPKDTFLNLTNEKRKRIETAAIDEFSEYGFDNSSINRIVAASDISKGSFYQYFEDKFDLFKYVILCIGKKKLNYITPVLQNPTENDFFTLLAEIYRVGLAFAKDYPEESNIGAEVYKNRNNSAFDEINQTNRRQGIAFYETLIDIAIARGEIDPSIEKPFIIHLLLSLQITAIDYFMENSEQPPWDDDILPTIQLMINFIKNGISAKTKESNQ